MTITLIECRGTDGGLFRDLGNFRSVNKWLEAMKDWSDETRALDVFVAFKGKTYAVRAGGMWTQDADRIVKRVARLPA